MQKGKINVQTENIFPVIKKFLYSDHEIFLRELISNATDATEKMKALVRSGESDVELGDLTIKVKLDKEAKTLSITDRGIGMNAAEIDKYINQIAFSSAEEFVEKFKDVDNTNIIGHFGLGFYSAFMVADNVELISQTYKTDKDCEAIKWECDGSPEFTIEQLETQDRGTTIVLHISEESNEFLEEHRVKEILDKYCKFLPVEIEFGEETTFEEIEDKKDKDGNPETKEVKKPRIINNTDPLWKKSPSELKEEDYNKFYRELYPMQMEDPLFHIHLNVDYPFNLTGILYFPKVKKNIEPQKDKIQLYSNQVFITDNVENIVPEFLTLLHGVIDSPDIPLNVSRSYLQSDHNVKKISNHISKKVADRLVELFKNDRKAFEEKWDDIKVFIQYGILSDDKFYDRTKDIVLLKNTEGEYFTVEEYKEKIKATQTNKDDSLVMLYAVNTEYQYTYIEKARAREYDVLIMDGPLDNHFVDLMERKHEKTKFARVDAESIDKLIEKEEAQVSKLTEDQQKDLKPVFEKGLNDKEYTVQFESLSESEDAVMITQPEFMRRMKEMQAMGGGGQMAFMGDMPDMYNVVVNSNHPMVANLVEDKDEAHKETIAKQLVDLAKLSQNLLTGKELSDFVKRSMDIIK
ncbi:MAG: molecular chaperone HtpG [Bacteroidetes bacterium 4572_112]|nr:MAG: molecular chaperone HtpG [Bacteroidetes bacterium 4572_112]